MRIAVIGNGVIGLTTAISLLREGKDVVIYSKDPLHKSTKDTVSTVACALWQPYKLFTNIKEYNASQLKHIQDITLNSLEEFNNILNADGNEKTGVSIRMHYEYSSESIYYNNNLKEDFYYIELLESYWRTLGVKNPMLKEKKISYPIPFKSINKEGVEQDFIFVHGYKTYVIDPSIFLRYLTDIFYKMGGTVVKKKINLNELKKIKEKVIFNCAGINGNSVITNQGTNNLPSRDLYPKSGVLMLYKLNNPSHRFENTIVLDELTILCRNNELTIGTGEFKEDESPQTLINRLIKHTKDFVESSFIEKFGLDDFLRQQSIDLNIPDKVLIGARPYFPDGKGYHLCKDTYIVKSKYKFNLYNNFGHGGSGVTLCWGCAKEITRLYSESIVNTLNSYNYKRKNENISDFNIEIAHFEITYLTNLSYEEIDNLLQNEKAKLDALFKQLNLYDKKVSISVLIDDKDAQNASETIKYFISSLIKIGVDFITYESRLVTFVNDIKPVLPTSILNEFNKYMLNHYKLACAQDIFVWHSLRLGLFDCSFDGIVEPLSTVAKNNEISFLANSIVSILDLNLKPYEDKADNYFSKTYGVEVASTIKRVYY